MEELGFDANDVGIFESDSPIPTEKRPLYLYPVASMAYRHREASIPEMIKAINKISNSRQNVKGVIHCTYGTSAKMRTLLLDSRFMFHGKHDKQEVYEKFLKSKTPNILVACGMAEGIDLKYDLARFQIILEIMYPSLSDNVNYWRMHHMPRHFKMDAFDNMVQQYGRGCRAPDDHCETFVLDSQAVRLCEQVRIPGWLKSAIKRLG
jgi:Rad3-related DNA helicase